jgi:hypothetical protein
VPLLLCPPSPAAGTPYEDALDDDENEYVIDYDYDIDEAILVFENEERVKGDNAGVSTGLRTHAQTCSHTRQSPWTLSLYGIIVLIQRCMLG